MVGVGEVAPEFEAPTSTGQAVKLSALRGHPVVLYFYPQADTPGCTIESKAFRDMTPELERKGVRVVGISTDDVPAQVHFAEKCSLPFPLVADATKSITRSYGVLGNGGRARRVSFFLDEQGRVVEVVDTSKATLHTDRARARYLTGP
ncbi:MAG TPA: peroxiredoxin [Thermoplasmata archaeon]|nr:peroxiredoxin [Thermoplasmata archaeon]